MIEFNCSVKWIKIYRMEIYCLSDNTAMGVGFGWLVCDLVRYGLSNTQGHSFDTQLKSIYRQPGDILVSNSSGTWPIFKVFREREKMSKLKKKRMKMSWVCVCEQEEYKLESQRISNRVVYSTSSGRGRVPLQ